MDLLTSDFQAIASSVRGGQASAKEVTEFFLKRIKDLDPRLNSFITVSPAALTDSEWLDKNWKSSKDELPLLGVPFALKDMYCTKGLRTTAGSKMLENFIPPYDATVVKKLKNAGAIILGKLNQDEFAMGSSNETSFFGKVKNPWNLDCVPGGSSGGSAAAMAARLVAGTLGTDTGGSIRQPSSFCNLVGVKPTYGRISRYGIIAYASSLDQAGPMVSCVRDAALTLEVLCGRDPFDNTTSDKVAPAFSKNLNLSMKGVRVGLVKEYLNAGGLDPEVQASWQNCIASLKSLGAEFIEVSIPLTQYAVPIYYLVAASEASSNLARYDGVKYGYRAEFPNLSSVDMEEFYGRTRAEGFGTEVKRRIMLGTYCLSSGYYDAYYNKACQVRRLLRDQFVETFKKCDVLLSPVTTSPAFKIGSRIADPLTMYLNDIFTVSTNLSGLPGMSVPFSFNKLGLPIGMQLTANQFEEQTMLNVASAIEESAGVAWKVPHV